MLVSPRRSPSELRQFSRWKWRLSFTLRTVISVGNFLWFTMTWFRCWHIYIITTECFTKFLKEGIQTSTCSLISLMRCLVHLLSSSNTFLLKVTVAQVLWQSNSLLMIGGGTNQQDTHPLTMQATTTLRVCWLWAGAWDFTLMTKLAGVMQINNQIYRWELLRNTKMGAQCCFLTRTLLHQNRYDDQSNSWVRSGNLFSRNVSARRSVVEDTD